MTQLFRCSVPAARLALLAVVAWQLLSACAASSLPLNSERIAARYGSYAVRVLQQDTASRVSSLESGRGDEAITRTFAITWFAEPNPAYGAVAKQITAGRSIGQAFQEAGWQIDKSPVFTGSIAISPKENIIQRLMRIDLPQDLAVHAYQFEVSRDGERHRYATIVELHHPDYLRERDLRTIYRPSLVSPDVDPAGLLTEVRRTLSGMSIEPAP